MAPIGISVHVGVNTADPVFKVPPLEGCVADAISMHEIAVKNKFDAIPPFIDEKATFENVKNAILHAANKLKDTGGIFLFTFAGHGSFGEGFWTDEPDDGQDETILLRDCILIDNYLRRNLWSQFTENVRILGIADSCHSGTVLIAKSGNGSGGHTGRVIFDAPAPPVEVAGGGVVSAPSPHALPADIETAREPRKRFRGFTTADRDRIVATRPEIHKRLRLELLSGAAAELKASLLTLAACQDNEEAVDNPDHGAFTRALLEVWNKGAFQGNYDDFINRIRAKLSSTEQHPVRRPDVVAEFFRIQRPFTI